MAAVDIRYEFLFSFLPFSPLFGAGNGAGSSGDHGCRGSKTQTHTNSQTDLNSQTQTLGLAQTNGDAKANANGDAKTNGDTNSGATWHNPRLADSSSGAKSRHLQRAGRGEQQNHRFDF